MTGDGEESATPVRWTGIVFFGVVVGGVIFLADWLGWSNDEPTLENLFGDVFFATVLGIGMFKADWFRRQWRRLWHRRGDGTGGGTLGA